MNIITVVGMMLIVASALGREPPTKLDMFIFLLGLVVVIIGLLSEIPK